MFKTPPVTFFAFLLCVSAAPADTPGPLRRQLDERLSAIDREITRRRDAGQADSAKALADQLQYFRDRLEGKAKPAGNDPQLHIITIYQGNSPNGQRQRQRFGSATVEVGVTDRPVILALGSNESVTWNLKIADGAKVQKVILGGYYEQELAVPLNNIPLEIYSYESKSPVYFSGSSEPEARPQTIGTLKKLTGLTASTFQFIYEPKASLAIGPDNPEWTAQLLLSDIEPLYFESMAFERARQREALNPIRFKALDLIGERFRFKAHLSYFTPLGRLVGPSDDVGDVQHIAIDPRGPTYYAISGHEVHELDLKNGKRTAMPINNRNIPRLSWPCGLTFDTKRSRLVLVSLGGEGFMYEYSPQNKQWGLIDSMNNIDLQAFTYSAEHDCYFGLGSSFGGNRSPTIYRFKPHGTVVKEVAISEPLPATRGGPNQGFQLIAVGRQLALLTPPHPDPTKADGENISRCLLIDPDTGKVTFSSVMSPQTPLQPAALAPAELEALWQAALGKDKEAAEAAMWKLASGGDKTIPFLCEKLPPLAKPNPDKLAATVAKLEHQDFKIREQTADELTRLGASISPDLQGFLKRDIPPGTRSYIETILKRIEAASTSQNLLDNPDANIRAEARAITILARMATPAAVEALQDLASGPPGLPRTTLAKSSLLHLGRD